MFGHIRCLCCFSTQLVLLGKLGNRTHLRCRDCGLDHSVTTLDHTDANGWTDAQDNQARDDIDRVMSRGEYVA